MSGIELHERLKTVSADCRLALLSFDVSAQHEADAIEAGSNFLLRKPFTAAELKATLMQALEALAKERPALHARLTAAMKTAPPGGRVAPTIMLPVIPSLKVGDRVQYQDKTETVQVVVVSQGELVVQLRGSPALISAAKLKRI